MIIKNWNNSSLKVDNIVSTYDFVRQPNYYYKMKKLNDNQIVSIQGGMPFWLVFAAVFATACVADAIFDIDWLSTPCHK